jgi:hypothetical protein
MKRITFFIVNMTFCLLMQAQIPNAPTNLQSPNAASLGLYGEVPVSFFTGIPEISIPLYTISQKDFSVPITLSYHAGGVRPDQHPGWVGTNWTLFAGGCISRTVKGRTRDELDYGNAPKAGFYWRYADVKKKNWDLITTLVDDYNNGLSHYGNNQMGDDNKDLQADEFSFNFGDYNGKFQLNENGQWIVTCNKPVKVIFDNTFLDAPNSLYPTPSVNGVYYPNYCKSFSGFTLITENGVKYIFGGSTDYIEYSKSFYDDERLMTTGKYWKANSWTANSWYLKEIDSPNDEKVTFEYERGSFIDQMYISSFQREYHTISDGSPLLHILADPLGLVDYVKSFLGEPTTLVDIPTKCGAFGGVSLGGCYAAQLISPLYLKYIKTPDCTVQFTSNQSTELKYDYSLYQYQLSALNDNLKSAGLTNPPLLPLLSTNAISTEEALKNLQWRELNAVMIYKGSSPLTDIRNAIKIYSFGYNNTDTERLFLTSLTSDNGAKTYSFMYDQKDLLPPYLASMTDHWGFYNGTKADIGGDYYNGTHMKGYYNQRNTNPSVMLYGSLKKITYPTGGTTEFTYEANQYSKQLNINRWLGVDFVGNYFTGGLRIKKMVNYANDGFAPVVKNYYYTQDYPSSKSGFSSSTGVLGGLAQYNMLNKLSTSDPNATYAEAIFSSQSVLPASTNSMGSHIGYSQVAEENSDGSYTIYKYTNFDNGYLDEKFDATAQIALTPYQPYNSKEQDRGLLYQKETYDNLGKIKILEKRQYVKSTNNTPDYLENMDGNVTSLCQSSSFTYSTGTVYKKYTYSNLLSDITTNFYEDQSQPLVQNQHFTYNNYNQITKVTTLTSDGKTKTKNTYYPLEISKGTLPSVQVKDYSTLATSLLNNNCLNSLIAEEDFIGSKFTNGIYNDYTLTTKGQPLLSNVFLSNTDKTFRKVYDCTKFDKAGNPLSVTGKDQLNTVYLWSYSYRYPVAEIKNASYQQVQDALGETYINNLSSMLNPADADVGVLNSLRTSLLNAQITTYTFNSLVGISSITDPRGIKTSYSYYPLTGRLYLSKNNDDNILARYAYQIDPYNGMGGYTAPVATVTPGATSYLPGTTGTAALGNISGGSGSYTYSWYLKNSTGTVLASNLNTTSTSFSFFCSEPGTLTIQCLITDNKTGLSTTVSTTFTSGVVPVYGSFSTASGYVYPYTSLYKIFSSVIFELVFLPTSSPMNVGTDYYIAEVSAGFRPSGIRTFSLTTGGRTWNITVYASGSVYCKIVSGPSLPVGTTAVDTGVLSYSL